jgi:hypothetical protein
MCGEKARYGRARFSLLSCTESLKLLSYLNAIHNTEWMQTRARSARWASCFSCGCMYFPFSSECKTLGGLALACATRGRLGKGAEGAPAASSTELWMVKRHASIQTRCRCCCRHHHLLIWKLTLCFALCCSLMQLCMHMDQFCTYCSSLHALHIGLWTGLTRRFFLPHFAVFRTVWQFDSLWDFPPSFHICAKWTKIKF